MTDNVQTLVSGGRVLHPAISAMRPTREFVARPPTSLRFLLMGRVGVGKSRFVTSIPNNLVLDIEDAARQNPKPKSMAVVLQALDDVDRTVDNLVQIGQKASGIDYVTIDTGDSLQYLEEEALAKRLDVPHVSDYGAKGAGWSRLAKNVTTKFSRLIEAGYGLIVTCHLKEQLITVNKKEVTVVRPSMTGGVVGWFAAHSDFFGMVEKELVTIPEYRTITVGGKTKTIESGMTSVTKRFLRVDTPELDKEVKHRVEMPERVELSEYDGWSDFINVYDEAVKKAQETATA